MEHRLTITLADEVFKPLVEAAMKQGRTPEEFAAERLAASVLTQTSDSRHQKPGDITRFFGSIDSGDPNSADNERLDADLAREYGSGLDGDE